MYAIACSGATACAYFLDSKPVYPSSDHWKIINQLILDGCNFLWKDNVYEECIN